MAKSVCSRTFHTIQNTHTLVFCRFAASPAVFCGVSCGGLRFSGTPEVRDNPGSTEGIGEEETTGIDYTILI